MNKPIIAICYDFDKTLSKSDMQDYGFIPSLGMKPAEFWQATEKFSEENGVERVLSYMYTMINLAKQKGVKITREWLNSLGKNIEYYPGVLTWFDRINGYAKEKGVDVKHYILSSGTKEIIEGSSIFNKFEEVFGCEFYYDPVTKEPVWPKFAINYTQKTQYIYRISKGIKDIRDDKAVNQKIENVIPKSNFIYLGDGMTDVPCMQLIKQNNGNSIAVYSKDEDRTTSLQLVADERINYACKSDFSEGEDLETTIKLIIDSIAIKYKLQNQAQELKEKQDNFDNNLFEMIK